LSGVKESDTGLALPASWNLEMDKQMMKQEHPLQVGRCTKIMNPGTAEAKYIVAFK
jgi:26S proteasome regulatory subunit T1